MNSKPEHTNPSPATREEEVRDAQAEHGISETSTRGPQSAPPENVDEEVAERYREMTERGAHQQGEGRLP